jgi:hypothetical protein
MGQTGLNRVTSFVPLFRGPFRASCEHETTFALRALDGDGNACCCYFNKKLKIVQYSRGQNVAN